MKAAVYDENGAPEVLRYADVPDPIVGAEDVLIQTGTISIQGVDLINRRSAPPNHPAHVVANAAAGTIVAVGLNVADRRVGDRVTS